MGKYTNTYPRRRQDDYATPAKAASELLKQFDKPVTFIEPCAGAGNLVRHLERAGHICALASDIAPREGHWNTRRLDARKADYSAFDGDVFITNPPWNRPDLYGILLNLAAQRPTWLLFDADWAINVEAAEYLDFCDRIVAQGRVKWFEDSASCGKENTAWYRFDVRHRGGPRFINARHIRAEVRLVAPQRTTATDAIIPGSLPPRKHSQDVCDLA